MLRIFVLVSNCFKLLYVKNIFISSVSSWCCLTGSRQSWATTFWRSTMGQTSCLLWLAPLMAPRFPSSCSAAATFFICCSPPTTADPMLASKYYMKVSQTQTCLWTWKWLKQHDTCTYYTMSTRDVGTQPSENNHGCTVDFKLALGWSKNPSPSCHMCPSDV